MPIRYICLALGMAAAAHWLPQPASAQADGGTIPEELRIIEDLPPPTEPLGDVGQLRNEAREVPELTDERSLIPDEAGESLFDQDHSLLLDSPDGLPPERLLPDDLDPDTDLVDRPGSADRDDILGEEEPFAAGQGDLSITEDGDDFSPDGDLAQDRPSGPLDEFGSAPPDRFDPDSGRSTAGGRAGGGSLF